MHILYIHQHFTTNAGASGTRSYDYARYLVQAGHQVTVISGVYALGPFVDKAGGLIQTRIIDGIKVVIINVPYANQMSFYARVMSFLLFAMLSVVVCFRESRVDVVLATSTPLTVGIPALLMRWLRRVPYVFEVRDIWPDVAVALGVLRNPVLIRLAYFAERLFYRWAARVQVISGGMKKILIDRGIPAEKITVVPTGVDLTLYENVKPDHSLRKKLGWTDRLIAVYAGAISDANGLEYVIEAAARLKDDPRVGFLLIGDGRRKPDLMEQAQRRKLSNLVFHDKMPKRKLISILADMDVGMLILKDLPDFRIAMPNKFFDYLAAGLAVIVNFQGDAATQLNQVGAGIATDPDDPETFASAIKRWAESPEELTRTKLAAKRLAKRYDRKEWAKELDKILMEVALQRQ